MTQPINPHHATTVPGARSPLWVLWLALGLALLAVAWLLPVNVKSLDTTLLREAGRDTPTVSGFGSDLLTLDKPGPAALALEAARKVGDSGADALSAAYENFAARHRDMMPWGGWDVALEPLLVGRSAAAPADSQPVLQFMVTTRARDNLRQYLAVSRLPAVQTVLKTGEVTGTVRFVPANRPGGQPLDAVILLTAYLWQTEHLSASLQREVRGLAETAVQSGQLGELEDFYLDILTLGRRLNWVQLSELLRTTNNLTTVGQFAHLTRVAPEHLSVIYTAALMTKSSDSVARYLITFGQPGAESLEKALSFGQGAVNQLVQRQAPVTENASHFGFGASFTLRHPELALFLKYAAFLVGVFFLVRAIDVSLFQSIESTLRGAFPRMSSGVIAAILTFIFFVFSEPFLLNAAPVSDYKIKLTIPVIAASTAAVTPEASTNATHMDLSTILSITAFAALQVVMYVICLVKISEIAKQSLPPSLKLKLMENEENLFDSGLYIGIAGTATALVLQVLGLIDANLLAAYSSNLFGIVCVALVKIRHVRPYKRQLIVEGQQATVTA